jgi:uncharacterized damage-inducible protein DinB
MYRKTADFVTDYSSERGVTRKVLESLTDGALRVCAADGHRTLGQIAYHLAASIPKIGAKLEFDFEKENEKSVPESSSVICERYLLQSERLISQVPLKITDDGLLGLVDFYSKRLPRGSVLSTILKHEIHHRAQMTVLMRKAGLRVPSIYGPSADERRV